MGEEGRWQCRNKYYEEIEERAVVKYGKEKEKLTTNDN